MQSSTITLLALFLAQDINPHPRERLEGGPSVEWAFDSDEGWKAVHDAQARAEGGALVIDATGTDPYLHGPGFRLQGPLVVRLRVKSNGGGAGQIFWVTRKDPAWGQKKSVHFRMQHDGTWQEIEAILRTKEIVTRLRLDPGTAPGRIEVDRMEARCLRHHPLEITRVRHEGEDVKVTLRNHGSDDRRIQLSTLRGLVAAGQETLFSLPIDRSRPFPQVAIDVRSEGLPDLSRRVCVFQPEAQVAWVTLRAAKSELWLAPDGSGALVRRDGKTVAVLAPLVVGVSGWKRTGTAFSSGNVTVKFGSSGNWITCSISADREVEGPVLRALGPLEQGLFAGLEFLGKGERSSSKLDIETHEHLRFAPDPLKVTMPLMACVTDRGTAAVTWKDMSLRPVFASPNFFDGTSDHRMSLRGSRIEAALLVQASGLDGAILAAVQRHGLPPLPEAPRGREEQWKLCMEAINGPLRNEKGWGHCAEPRWNRAPFADFASTIWRITGKAPDLGEVRFGGAHLRNESIYFVTGRVEEWLKMKRRMAEGVLKQQKPDGSFRYTGKYRRGHFEDTASGVCGRPAVQLLEFAQRTGDARALEAGLRTLEYMKRFRTPRGAQTWELALHTPDIMASAHLVRAYVRGYELTGRKEYLERARYWALTGVPFVYLWGCHPTMAYATIPVYGATNWRAPNWIGLPVQWCGLVYAYSLALFSHHDATLDWKRLARGILIAGEQMQYPQGDKVGCLPDIFHLRSQGRAGPSINPCALVSLRLVLDGETASLSLASDGKRRVLAPFPVSLKEGAAVIRARKGTTYGVLIDGSRVERVESRGVDEIPLSR